MEIGQRKEEELCSIFGDEGAVADRGVAVRVSYGSEE